ncbi:hypothetical protein D3C71_1304350 [compost metagenome]
MDLIIFCGGTRIGIVAQICGDVKAAKIPAKARNKNIVQKPLANPHRKVETANPRMPNSITFFRFKLSEMGPATRANNANPRAYAPTNHPDTSTLILNSCRNVGNSGEVKNVSVPIMNIIKKYKLNIFFIINRLLPLYEEK